MMRDAADVEKHRAFILDVVRAADTHGLALRAALTECLNVAASFAIEDGLSLHDVYGITEWVWKRQVQLELDFH